MNLPTYFVLNGFRLHTVGIFITIAFFVSLFILWQEGKKDGFGEEKLFDLFITGLFSGLLFSRIFFAFDSNLGLYSAFYSVIRFWTPGLSSLGFLLGFFIPVLLFAKKWRWSVYRILDILSLSFSLGMSVIFLGLIAYYKQFTFLFLFSGYLLMFAALSILRRKALSGLVFSIFVLINTLVGVILLPGRFSLIFYVCLFTISLVNFLTRINKHMDNKEK